MGFIAGVKTFITLLSTIKQVVSMCKEIYGMSLEKEKIKKQAQNTAHANQVEAQAQRPVAQQAETAEEMRRLLRKKMGLE